MLKSPLSWIRVTNYQMFTFTNDGVNSKRFTNNLWILQGSYRNPNVISAVCSRGISLISYYAQNLYLFSNS